MSSGRILVGGIDLNSSNLETIVRNPKEKTINKLREIAPEKNDSWREMYRFENAMKMASVMASASGPKIEVTALVDRAYAIIDDLVAKM